MILCEISGSTELPSQRRDHYIMVTPNYEIVIFIWWSW